jgi:dolichol-phosphate mannosyltransferase
MDRSSPARSLSLVIPAFNEEAGIRHAVEEADRALSELCPDYEILVVDDGSADGTSDAVTSFASGNRHVRLLRHETNKGYGAAIRTGFEAARCERIAFTDADCQFHLSDLDSLVRLTEENDLAVGYRLDRQDPPHRRFFSWGYNTLARTFLGTRVRDCDCALKVFRRDAAARLLPNSRGFFVNTEILTRANQEGLRIAEAGVRHRPRLRGESKVSLWEIPRTLATLLPFWWSQVLFAQNPTSPDRPEPNPRAIRLGILAVMVMAALLFFSRLGCPLQEPEEPRYAEIPRQMMESGQYLIPYLHGQPYCDKPPLLYWAVMGSYMLFGVHDWAARLVPSGAGFLCVMLTCFWGTRTLGPRAGLAAAVMLCLSPRFVYLSRLLTMNSLLCLCVIAALASAHLAILGPRMRMRWWLASACACAFGLLTKGPVALALVAVPLAVVTLLDSRLVRPSIRQSIWYVMLALSLAAPWYVALAVHDPEFLQYFFWKQNLVRYVAPFDHAKPFWYFLSDVTLGMLPWSLLLPAFVRHLRSFRTAPQRPATLGFMVLAFIWTFAFFSLGGSKRAGYILPAMPPLALALGCYLAKIIHTAQASGRQRPAVACTLCAAGTFAVLLALVNWSLPGYARRFAMRGQVRPLARLAADKQIPVACYPKMWDSVSFYLSRADVRVYTVSDRSRLIKDLRGNPRTLAFVKSDTSLAEFLGDLPQSLEFVPRGRQGSVTVGWVRRREEALGTTYAAR